MKAVREKGIVFVMLLLFCLLLPVLRCQAGEREEQAIRYFTEEPAGRYDIYCFLQETLEAEAVTREEDERVQRVFTELLMATERLPDGQWGNDAQTISLESLRSNCFLLVTPSEKFNAYALPGNILVVNRGVLELLSDDELAGIMAHELGHLALGHPVAAMRRSSLACRCLRRSAKWLEDMSEDNKKIKAAEAFWEAVQLSRVLRREEREADEWAAQLLAVSDFDIYAVVNLWPWLEEMYGPVSHGSNHLSYKERSRIYAAVCREDK